VTALFEIVPLSAEHDRLAFSCGVGALDGYLHHQAGQDMRRRIANCFVATPRGTNSIAGFYTLSAASIPLADLPRDQAKRLPRYPVLPAALIGRLAIDRRQERQGLGSALLVDAFQRASRAAPAIFAIIVDAKDDNAARFYRHFGFQPFVSREMSLFLPVATAAKLDR
jgi:GNAT superfamily N-acetyltransferase